LFIVGQTGQLVAVDLAMQAVGIVDVEGVLTALAITTQPDGTLLILDGYELPGRILQVDPSAIVDVTNPPASIPSTLLLDTTESGASPVGFAFHETGMLEAMHMTQTPGGTVYVSRTGRGDVAQLGLGGIPSICPIAGTGRGGSNWGTSTDLPLPGGVAPGPGGSLLVADPINRRVLQLNPP
jgi:hypothetical protein